MMALGAGTSVYFGLASSTAVAVWAFVLVVIALSVNPDRVLGTVAGLSVCYLMIYGTVNVTPRTLVVIASLGVALASFIGVRRAPARVIERSLRARIVLVGASVVILVSAISSVRENSFSYAWLVLTPIGFGMLAVGSRFAVGDLRRFGLIIALFATLQLGQAILEFQDVRFSPWSSFGRTTLVEANFLIGGQTRAEGMLGHPIPLSMLFVVATVLAWLPHMGWRLNLRVVFTAGMLLGVVLTGTRTAFVALIIALIVGVLGPRLSLKYRIASLAVLAGGVAVVAASSTASAYLEKASNVLATSGSYTHRRGAFESIPRVLDARSGLEWMFGGGVGSEGTLFDQGLLQSDNFHVVDNQFVSTLAWAGVIGLAALAAVFVCVLLAPQPAASVLGGAIIVYFNSFDLLRWQGEAAFSWLVFGFAAATALAVERPATAAGRERSEPRIVADHSGRWSVRA